MRSSPKKYRWVASRRPHAYFPHIKVPCWVLVEVEDAWVEDDGDASNAEKP